MGELDDAATDDADEFDGNGQLYEHEEFLDSA
jgi:hypothetical protein